MTRERLPQWAINVARRIGIRWRIDHDLARAQRDIYALSVLIGSLDVNADSLPEPKEKAIIAKQQEILRERRAEIRKHAREAALYAKSLLPTLQSRAFWQAFRMAREGAAAATIEAETRKLADAYDMPIEALANTAIEGARAGWEEWKKIKRTA